jgi:protein TonB
MSYQALLFCPDDKTARVVTQVLSELDFTVEPCNEPFAAVKKLMAQHFDAIVVDCDNEQNAGLLFKSAHNSNSNQNSLSVAVVEGQAGVAKAFRIGANLVLTKPINVEQSKGTLRVARGLLRKADSAKSASQATASPEFSPKPSPPKSGLAYAIAPSTSFSKPAAVPSTTQPPLAPLATASAAGLEVDPEPTPEPGPTEAALLESMPDPVASAGKSSSQPAPGSRAPYPWQPVSKAAEPMASALRRAAEAAGKAPETEDPSHPPYKLSMSASAPTQGLSSFGVSSAGGAASAPAPAKELVPTADVVAPRPSKESSPSSESEVPAGKFAAVEPPTFADLAVKDHEELDENTGSSKKPVLVVALLVVVAAAAYLGWTKFHPAIATMLSGRPSAHSIAPSPSTQQAVQTPQNPGPLQSELTAPESNTMTATTGAAPKPSAGVKANQPEVAPDVTTRLTPAVQSEEPIVVKSGPAEPRPASPVQETSVPAAPPMLGVAGSSDPNQIAGIVSTGSVAMPKAAPQSLRISQGVSQGLIVKRVSPIYPQQAIQTRVQGAVQLEATISKNGAVKNVKALSGDAILARSAADAVRQWKYKPYFLNGEPVEIQTEITVNFKLP